MKKNLLLIALAVILFGCNQTDTPSNKVVPQDEMEKIFNEIKTPFKYVL